jgi:uncharacterized protein YndB with AHSA1/START domain
MATPRVTSAARIIPAAASTIFDVLANPTNHPRFDGSGTVISAKAPPQRLALGSTFSMDMKKGVPYFTTNRVVEFEENRRIAWHHFSRLIWRYELEPVDGGTKVTESFDFSVPWGAVLRPLGYPGRIHASMDRSLARLADIAAEQVQGSPSES